MVYLKLAAFSMGSLECISHLCFFKHSCLTLYMTFRSSSSERSSMYDIIHNLLTFPFWIESDLTIIIYRVVTKVLW